MSATPLHLVLEKLERVKDHGTYFTARCPAHEDKRESLSISEGKHGQVLLKCHAGCQTPQIVQVLGLTMPELFPTSRGVGDSTSPRARYSETARPSPVATYPYHDENGTLLYQVLRYAPKEFRQRRPDGRGGWIWNLEGTRRVLYKLPEVIQRAQAGKWVLIVEGEKDADNLARMGVLATTNSGGAAKWEPAFADVLTGAKVAILPDNDDPGRLHAGRIALSLVGKSQVRIVELPNLAPKGDVSDWLGLGGTPEQLKALVDKAPDFNPADTETFALYLAQSTHEPGHAGDVREETVVPVFDAPVRGLAPDLQPVKRLLPEMIPTPLRGWLHDAAQRMSCPLEFVAIPALVALGSLVGRQIGIRPKQHDDWTEYPNLWGAVVGYPGALKTPAISEALRPLHRLEQESRERHELCIEQWEADALIHKADADRSRLKLKKGTGTQEERRLLALEALAGEKEEDKPIRRRYIVNDATVEKLGELLRDNPNGLLQFRDEIGGWLKSLEKVGHESDRAFYLEAWSGKGGFTYDRIGRGEIFIPNVCLSLIGTIQPDPLLRYLRRSFENGDDGFVARFQLLVWPDRVPYRYSDHWADSEVKEGAYAVVQRLANLYLSPLGAAVEEGQAYLHFDAGAQHHFRCWLEELEARLQGTNESPYMAVHLSKYRKLLPALALLLHLIEGGSGPVSQVALQQALVWLGFFESHARRVYAALSEGDSTPALALNERLKNSLPNPFTIRDVYRKGWTGLSSLEDVERAVAFLEARGRVKTVETQTGGRPKVLIFVNPELAIDSSKADENLRKQLIGLSDPFTEQE